MIICLSCRKICKSQRQKSTFYESGRAGGTAPPGREKATVESQYFLG